MTISSAQAFRHLTEKLRIFGETLVITEENTSAGTEGDPLSSWYNGRILYRSGSGELLGAARWGKSGLRLWLPITNSVVEKTKPFSHVTAGDIALRVEVNSELFLVFRNDGKSGWAADVMHRGRQKKIISLWVEDPPFVLSFQDLNIELTAWNISAFDHPLYVKVLNFAITEFSMTIKPTGGEDRDFYYEFTFGEIRRFVHEEKAKTGPVKTNPPSLARFNATRPALALFSCDWVQGTPGMQFNLRVPPNSWIPKELEGGYDWMIYDATGNLACIPAQVVTLGEIGQYYDLNFSDQLPERLHICVMAT
ncbi:hypothetical protein C8R43DRAFT_954672 [Mycena crocata]|nr:hypothetical protein C8R43DRAFT_954672 [Mycena crocata]